MSAPSERALHAAREATTHEWSMREILKAAMDPALGPDRLVVAGPYGDEIIEKACAWILSHRGDMPPEWLARGLKAHFGVGS